MKKSLIVSILVVLMSVAIFAAPEKNGYPFFPGNNEDNILAYWYNCPKDSVLWEFTGKSTYFQSRLHIYGEKPSKSFTVNCDVFQKDGQKAYSRTFEIVEGQSTKDFDVKFSGDFFRISCPVNYLKENPGTIKIAIISDNAKKEKTITCKYHKLYGNITDFDMKPLKGFVKIYPDAFGFEVGVWSDQQGYYEIDLPERTYNCFYINDGLYRTKTLETWAWHIIMDSDQKMDFKIGTGEVYNLNAWSSNGGFNTYFVTFRPMVLFTGEKEEEYTTQLNGKSYTVHNIASDLKPEDIKVTINGQPTEIISLQRYFETGEERAMAAYMVQVKRLTPVVGKQSICLEYKKVIKVNDKELKQYSQGFFQFYNNIAGLSKYF